MPIPLALIAGIVPMLIYPWFLYWMDRYEKEPLPLIGAAFLWGFIPAAILSLISQLILGFPFMLLDQSGAVGNAVLAIGIAPVTEEIFKGLAVWLVFLLWRNEFDGVFDGIIYGGLVGFGFAAIENVFYFAEAGGSIVFLRAVLFGLNHAFYTSLTGVGFGVARHARKGWVRIAAPVGGLAAAMFVHSLHNTTMTLSAAAPLALCFGAVADWIGVLFVLGLMIAAIRRERQWLIDELADEVERQTLTAHQYAVVSAPVARFTTRFGLLFSEGPAAFWRVGRYFHTLTELAYKKHAYERRGEQGSRADLIEQLREQAKTEGVTFAGLG
jgi:RsiW-degrading membrane proteinase PrsW (M82 family)